MPGVMIAEGGGMTAITAAVGELMSMAATMLTTITGNPVLCALFASGFVGIAISIVSRLKNA